MVIVSTPKAPDPNVTAAAQAGYNQDAATASNLSSMTNTSGPWGSTTYNQTGTTGYTNSKGEYVTLPQYTQTTQYSPGQQAIFDQTQSAQQNIAGIANDQSASLKDYLNTKFNFDNGSTFSGPTATTPGQFSYGSQPFSAQDFSFNNQDAANWSTDLANQRILPQQQQDRAALETQLTNKGIRPGTQAWNSEMERLGRTQTDQNNQLALTGRSQAYNEALGTAQNNFGQATTARGINSGEALSQYQTNAQTQLAAQQAAYQQALSGRQQNFQEAVTGRNQPLNEISALLSGSQIANPNNAASATPQSQVAGVDYTGLVNNNYNQQVASSNAMLGGLFGLAGSAATAGIKYSDRRVKRDIKRIATLANGLPWYSFRYLWSAVEEFGVMAQDVLKVRPDAVHDINGILAVDYAKVLR